MAFLFTKFRIQNKLKNKEVIVLRKQIKHYLRKKVDKLLDMNWNGTKELVDELPDELIDKIHQEIDKVFEKNDNNIKEEEINEKE